MAIELQRRTGEALAQTVRIRAHEITVDGSVAEGGSDAGPSPHDLYDAALGACKAITVLWYARRKGIPVDDITTVIVRDDTQERAGVYRLVAKLRISGELSDAQLEDLGRVAAKCPVHKLMAEARTEVSTEVERIGGR